MLKFLNVGVEHGVWGECAARRYLRKKGYDILEVNVRPFKQDKRLELDIVAIDKQCDCLVFLEVKQHNTRSFYGSERMRSVDKRKISNVRKAANAWRRKVEYMGAFRFDVLQIYGTPELGVVQIVHTKDVRMFVKSNRFVDWS